MQRDKIYELFITVRYRLRTQFIAYIATRSFIDLKKHVTKYRPNSNVQD